MPNQPTPYSQIIGTGSFGSPAYGSARGKVRQNITGGKPSRGRRGGQGTFGTSIRKHRGTFAGSKEAYQPSLADILLQQLMDMLGQETGSVDANNLRAQIEAQINPIFDARRRAIEDLMSRAQTRVGQGRREIEGAYESLGQNYEQMLPAVRQQSAGFEDKTKKLHGELKSNIQGNYARTQQEQADLFAQLGIEEAAPDVLNEQATQQLASLNAAESTGAANLQRQQEMGNIDESYYRQGAPLARLEGTNRSSDLLSDLMDYLAEQEGALGELEAQRGSEITGAFNQLMGQAGQSAQEQQRWQQEKLFDLLMQQYQNAQKGPGGTEAEQFLAQSGLRPQDQQDVFRAFAALEQNPDVVTGRQFDKSANTPGARVALTPARVKQLAREFAEQNRMTPAELQALLNLIDLTYG